MNFARDVAASDLQWQQECERLRVLFAQAPSFMSVLKGPEHRFELANAAFARMIGGREVVGSTVQQALGHLRGQVFFDILDKVYATGEPFVGRAAEVWFGVSGPESKRSLVDFVYQPMFDAAGHVFGIFVEGNDVTELVGATDDLREREQRLRFIIEAATDYAILTMCSNRLVTSWSAGAAATFGYTAGEIIGRSADILFTLEDRETGQPQQEAGQARETGSAPDRRWHLRKDGSRVFLNGSVQLLSDNAGQEIGFLKIARDETERLAAETALKELNATLERRVEERSRELIVAEEAMRQSQKMEAVGQLTGGVAHDFNNLLTVLKSSTDLLRRPGLSDERRGRYLDAISETVDRAAKLTGQLLAFARRQALKPEVFDAVNRLRTLADILDTVLGARIQVRLELLEEPCHIRADASQFETALINMAVNARDAMGGEGLLTLSIVGEADLPPIRGHAGVSGPFVAISIADTGEGIPSDTLVRIFEPFFTTKEIGKGTGLGLSQVFGFAKQSGGDVDVASEVGHGTTFTLHLPQVAPPEDGRADADSGGAMTSGGGRRVLVVEDNNEIGRFATQILEDLGYRAEWTSNAGDALIRLDKDGPEIDVVFSDVIMPGGMNGVELAQEVRRLYPSLPVVLTSGYSHVLAEEGPQGFELVQKPYSADQLSCTLRKAILLQRSRVS